MQKFNFYTGKLWFFVLGSLMLFPILPRAIESILMICFGMLSLGLFVMERPFRGKEFKLKNLILVLILSIVFIVFLISLIYSSNLKEGINQTIRVLPLAMFPIVFGFLRKDILTSKQLENLKNLYIFAIAICLIFLNTFFFEKLYFSDTSHWEMRQYIENATDVHGTYMSIWIGFGILVLLSKLSHEHALSKKAIILELVLIGYFVYWQITIGARMPLASTIFLCLVFILVKFNTKKRIGVSLIFVSTCVMFLFLSKSEIIERIEKVMTFDYNLPQGDYALEFMNISSEDIRKGIFFCTLTLVKQSPLIGYGIGDVQTNLDKCYKEKINSNVYQKFNYNTHNQYFQVLLSSGIVALLLFITSLLLPLYISIKKRDFLLFSFTAIMTICFVTENIINRHDGAIFYGIFNSILIFNSLGKK